MDTLTKPWPEYTIEDARIMHNSAAACAGIEDFGVEEIAKLRVAIIEALIKNADRIVLELFHNMCRDDPTAFRRPVKNDKPS